MKTYDVYTQYGRNRLMSFEFSYSFEETPLVGDIILDDDKKWFIESREWHEGRLVLVVRKNTGLILA